MAEKQAGMQGIGRVIGASAGGKQEELGKGDSRQGPGLKIDNNLSAFK